ncbi:MAG: thioredoxin family protein [Candidatus Omnitrophota bacterium]
MRIKVFGKQGCAKCDTTKNKFNHFLKKNGFSEKAVVEFLDMDTVDGMAEGAYNDVLKIPTTIIEKDNNVIARWEGEVPKTEEFKTHF